MTEQRRLAAILVADVVGYSKLIGNDETGTLTQLRSLRTEIIEPQIAKHTGRLFKAVGDGFLVEFASAVQAVAAAREIQQANTGGTLQLRIGIHVGDVVVQGDDLLGDGVNIAARIESVAEPGGIAISRQVHDQVRDRLDLKFVDKGQVELKNIARPVRVFALGRTMQAGAPVLPLPDKPSIAILPFQNMSDDPEQEYFVDGLVEDITTALSRFKSLFVIARNSAFTYKGKTVDIKQVGRELGVRYVLEGSVRKAAGRLRITGQLIDATTGAHLWADRFEGTTADVFDLQDRIARGTVASLDQSISTAEIARALRKPTNNLGATDYFYRGLAAMRRFSRESVDEAERMFVCATEADAGFAAAYGMACWCYIARKGQGWTEDFAWLARESRRLAELAWNADKDDPYAIGVAGYALGYVAEDLETANVWLDRAMAINPDIAFVRAFAAAVKGYLGRWEEAAKLAEEAVRLSPREPAIVLPRNVIILAHLHAGRYSDGARLAQINLGEFPRNVVALRNTIACLALSGDLHQARSLLPRLLEADPMLTQSTLRVRSGPHQSAEVREALSRGLRLAGLPEGNSTPTLALPDKPSIAVLPFQNMSGDSEQEYFVDGLVEDIITALSRFKSLFVIARNSSFIYKGKAVDIKQVGRELGVRYILEGSVRKAGSRVRITGQLIEAVSGTHLWAQRFDGALEDVFDLQDRISSSVVSAIVPTLDRAEVDRAKSKRTENLSAYDHYLRGLARLSLLDREGTSDALDHFREAIRLDSTFSTVHAWASIIYSRRRQSRWMLDIERESEEGLRLGRRAIDLAPDDALALSAGGFAIAFFGGDLDAGLSFIDRALGLNPNLALAWQASGWVRSYIGDPDTAIEHLSQSIRLTPVDPQMAQLYLAMAIALRCAGRYADSAAWAKKALAEVPGLLPAFICLAASQALAGQLDEAKQTAERALRIDPNLRTAIFSNSVFFRRPQDREALLAGVRLAGIPE